MWTIHALQFQTLKDIMKDLLRKLFSPILAIFEKGTEDYTYKSLNRKILIIVSALFLSLALIAAYLSRNVGDPGYLIPVIVFAAIAIVGMIVGLLGNDRAVAKIWGNR